MFSHTCIFSVGSNIILLGLPNVYEYNADHYNNGSRRTDLFPAGIDFNDYLAWLQDTANVFADIVILYKSVYGKSVAKWMPFVEYQLAWFDEFYRQRNGLSTDGKLIVYPGSGCETYKLAFDAAATVSGLYRVISDLLESGVQYVKGNKTYYEEYRGRVPDTPLQKCPGARSKYCSTILVRSRLTLMDRPYLHCSRPQLLIRREQ